MRKLNRMIAASALAVPMALGASGIAVADVAEGSSGVQNQVEALEGNSSDEDDFDRGEIGEDLRDAFGVGDDEGNSNEGNSEEDGLLNGLGDDEGNSDEGNSEEDGLLEILEEIFGGGSDEGDSEGDSNLLG
jgi:hypothetical protein